MWSEIITVLILVGILLATVAALSIPLLLWQRTQRRRQRDSPLTRDLVRPPGHSLRSAIEDLHDEVASLVALFVSAPLFVYSIHISHSHFNDRLDSVIRIVFSVLLACAINAVIGYRLFALLNLLKRLRLGLDGELFTGEELNQLMLYGCRVFHDIPYPYGNIDHVVVSHSGAYSVNTKMRSKPERGEGRWEIIVDHEQGVVHFPGRDEQIPTNQLESEANWLSKTLTSATGNRIVVEPMLALPGWYIQKRIGRGSVYVFNPRQPKKFFVQRRQQHSAAAVQQIAHQLEQLCRNIEPSFRRQRPQLDDPSRS